MSQRGLIISPPFEAVGNSIHLISRTIDPLTLRKYLLYWDLLDLPVNNMMDIADETEEIQQLIRAGVLKRSNVNLLGEWGGGYIIPAVQAAAFVANNKNMGQTWSIAQIGNNLILRDQETLRSRAIEVELYNAVPVPVSDVPIDSILELKERRKDQLLKFRSVMDNFYLELAKSRDVPRDKDRTINQIRESYHDLNRVMHESKMERILSTLKVELSISNFAKEVLVAYAAGKITIDLGQPIATGILVGAAAAALKVSINLIPKIKQIPPQLLDFAYLTSLERDLVIKEKHLDKNKKKRRRRKKQYSQMNVKKNPQESEG